MIRTLFHTINSSNWLYEARPQCLQYIYSEICDAYSSNNAGGIQIILYLPGYCVEPTRSNIYVRARSYVSVTLLGSKKCQQQQAADVAVAPTTNSKQHHQHQHQQGTRGQGQRRYTLGLSALQLFFLLSVLGWYIPGLSELPLVDTASSSIINSCRTFFQRFFVFSFFFCTFSSFS